VGIRNTKKEKEQLGVSQPLLFFNKMLANKKGFKFQVTLPKT
jgi:hypothetical protein